MRAALNLALEIEEPVKIEIDSSDAGDEARLLRDLEARRADLGRELLDKLDDAITLLRWRTRRLAPGDVLRRRAA
jgi:hypothetical protein